jgi:3-oxoacyl-[acyl-carrier protein] reductase
VNAQAGIWSERRVALVTGGAAGIGRAECLALGEAGADVAILAHTDVSGAEETARRCRAAGRRALVVRADVRRSDEVRQAVEAVVEGLGRLDILVNNAGALGAHLNVPLLDLDEATWHLMLDSHLTGTFLCLKHAAPHMVRQRWGRVINTSSVHGRIGGRPTLGHYGAAKAGVIALTRTAARELGPHGVTVNAISPGYVATERLGSTLPPERLDALARQIPVGRIGTPAEIGAAVVFLASDGAAFVNGAVLDITGGRMEYV